MAMDPSIRHRMLTLAGVTSREFNPSLHPRNPAGHEGGGRFRSKFGAAIDMLTDLATIGEDEDRVDGLYLGDEFNGSYFDWSTRTDGGYRFEAGDDDDAVVLTLNRGDLQQTFAAMSVTRLQESEGGAHADPAVAALAAVGYSGAARFDDDAYFDWTTVDADGRRTFEAGDGSDAVQVELTPVQFDQLYARIGLTLMGEDRIVRGD